MVVQRTQEGWYITQQYSRCQPQGAAAYAECRPASQPVEKQLGKKTAGPSTPQMRLQKNTCRPNPAQNVKVLTACLHVDSPS
jgi:hypothetical protein